MARYSRSYSTRGSYSRGSSGRSRSSYGRSSSRRSSYRSSSRPSSSYSSRSRSSYGSPSSRRSSYSSRPTSSLRTRTQNGYSQYYDRSSGNWKYTHRRVAEKKLGGRIRSGYEVHHRDGNKRNNSPSNLSVLTRSAHRAIHRRGGFLSRLFRKRR